MIAIFRLSIVIAVLVTTTLFPVVLSLLVHNEYLYTQTDVKLLTLKAKNGVKCENGRNTQAAAVD